jgi:glycerophosphoryl diester phosphodiesterase
VCWPNLDAEIFEGALEVITQRPSCWTSAEKQDSGPCVLTWCYLLIGLMAIWSLETAIPQERLGKFDLSGHRGARGLRPENTLPAFSKALSIGVSPLEMDAAVTKDGVVVISHDPSLDPNITRRADGKWIEGGRWLIKDMTLKQLQTYDVGRIRPGTDYAKQFSSQVSVDGTRIPTLSAVIELVRTWQPEDAVVSIEPKFDPTDGAEPSLDREPLARAVIEVLRKAKFAQRSNIQSFDLTLLQIVKRIAPEFPIVYNTTGRPGDDTIGMGAIARSKWTGDFDVNEYKSVVHAIKAAGGKDWSVDSWDLDAAQVKTAHELGIRVTVWTVNEPGEMVKFIDMGVDGIITDYPDRLRKVLSEKGIAVPAEGGRRGGARD